MTKLRNIKGLLLDLEGVIYSGNKIIDGSIETIDKLRSNDFIIRYLTNTTTSPKNKILEKLRSLNLKVSEDDIFSPTIAANEYLKDQKINEIFLLTDKSLEEDFKNFKIDYENACAVIIGDIYKDFNWENLNLAFEIINKNDSTIIALHKNRYCRRDENLSLDLGPFVAALEYATNKKAVVMGKPEKKFFSLALKNMGLSIDKVIMVGDDIVSDIGGAKQNNIFSIQVRTGKYQESDESGEFLQPDLRINSIADLADVLI